MAFPTDTVYGVGAHAFQPDAIARLYELKRRPATMAIPLLLGDAEEMESVCRRIPDEAFLLGDRFWPGGLSLVLDASEAIQGIVTARGPTVAVRVPAHEAVRELCRELAAPLGATSANLHGQPDSLTATAVLDAFGGRIPLVLDGGPCHGGLPSTVVDLTRRPAEILRQGPISRADLSAVIRLRE